MDEISVVIPAYNEEQRLAKTLQQVNTYLKKHFKKFEIIVVDDGSTDATASIAQRYKVKLLLNRKNRGKGYSVRKGVLKAKYKHILLTDSDLSTPIFELNKFIHCKEDIIIASRDLQESDIQTKQPFFRRIIGSIFPLLREWILHIKVKDSQCGFKLFKQPSAKKIFSLQRTTGFAFDAEILFIARTLGYSIKEVPVIWIDKKGSKVNPFKDSFRMLHDVIKIKKNNKKGYYKR